MSVADQAVQLLLQLSAPKSLRWVNSERASDDWKVKLFEHEGSNLQVAIFDRTKIVVLLEHETPAVPRTVLLAKRPQSHALRIRSSHFASIPGACYEVADLSALSVLIATYLQSAHEAHFTLAEIEGEFQGKLARSLGDSFEARRERLARAQKKPRVVTVTTTAYLRNADVVAEVLIRANGCCEGCGNGAPFTRRTDETPYLEVHHQFPLSSGGEDTVENAIALCPNCHRREHYGISMLHIGAV